MNMPVPNPGQGLLGQFRRRLSDGDPIASLAAGLIGHDAEIDGPFGRQRLVYADYVASGRALMQVEQFILQEVLPFYANSHTEASFCGGFMTRLRTEARREIANCCGADDEHAVVFTGSGATAGINRLVSLLGIAEAVAAGDTPCVIVGPYEHHSNILPWRESGAEIVEIAESPAGGPDLAQLTESLARLGRDRLVVGSFSAASNVTGIVTDVAQVTRILKAAGAKAVWDYAGGGPYLPIAMNPRPDASIDAVVVSPHKFLGGPGASGILILRRDAATTEKPTWPGGGTVKFVSSTRHDYSDNLATREEAGTPNSIGDVRAALAFIVKQVIGDGWMAARNRHLAERALEAWTKVDGLELIGNMAAERLPIFSFRVRDGKGGYVHHQLVTRMLSDRFGIQARGGCACAGPYVLRLLSIDDHQAESIRQTVLHGDESSKPGFVRLNFSVLLSEGTVDHILTSVARIASDAASFSDHYRLDSSRAIFSPKESMAVA